MAAPLSPPPSTDTGALTYPRTLQRWLDDNPVTPLERVGSYITLPAFSVAVSWLGYSTIVAAFNFEGPNNFSLKTMSAFSSDPNYLLAVMWSEEDGTTHRYVFWSGVGEVMPFELIPYNGQLIKKNFRFEVWSTNSTPAVQSEALTFYTSVLGGVDYRYGSDFVLVSADTIVTNFKDDLVADGPSIIPNGELYITPSGPGAYTYVFVPQQDSTYDVVFGVNEVRIDTILKVFPNTVTTILSGSGSFTGSDDYVYILYGPTVGAGPNPPLLITATIEPSNCFVLPLTFPSNASPTMN